ncbi:transcriptional regulator [candidate division KSB1 bacterium]|nr:transcriptional regulator [candidate division KSB1 bacterium]
MEDKKVIVLEAFKKADKPLRPGDVVKVTGLEPEEVSKIIDALKKSGEIFSPKRCFYAPPVQK